MERQSEVSATIPPKDSGKFIQKNEFTLKLSWQHLSSTWAPTIPCFHSLPFCPLKPSGVRMSYEERERVSERRWWQRVNDSLDSRARFSMESIQRHYWLDVGAGEGKGQERHTDMSSLGHRLGVGSVQDTERRAGSVGKTRCSIWFMLNLSCQRKISNRMSY